LFSKRARAEIPAMSDKTKYLARRQQLENEIRLWRSRARQNPPIIPACWCGMTDDVWAIHDREGLRFYCSAHLPDEWRD
jgi:hypothetical protein